MSEGRERILKVEREWGEEIGLEAPSLLQCSSFYGS